MMSVQEWNSELERLANFFRNAELPAGDFQINRAYLARDLRQYVNANLDRAALETSVWNLGPLLRLQELEQVLRAQST